MVDTSTKEDRLLQNEAFVKWLDAALKQRSWTYSELAGRAGISQSGLSRAISGKKGIGCDMCIKIALALNVPIEIPLRLAEILPPLTNNDSPLASEASEIINNLSPELQDIALDLLRTLYRRNQDSDDDQQ